MTVIAFLGPSLPREVACTLLAADYRAPARQGDILRAAHERPRAILLIDGFFSHVAAVWHREILWAMARGIHVFGAASMGALRAAELHAYGMVGYGAIFEAYRAGELEDDDEVAVVHGPPELGFAALSEAMINIRATLQAARRANVIGSATSERLLHIAKRLYFADRKWPAVLERACAESTDPTELGRLAAWLPHGKVDLKREDATGLLQLTVAWWAEDPAPKRVDFAFQYTSHWHAALIDAGAGPAPNVGDAATATAVIEELKLSGGELFEAALNGAAMRVLAREQVAGEGAPGTDTLLAAAECFRRCRGLELTDDLVDWLTRNQLQPADFRELLEDELRLERTRRRIEAQAPDRLIDELRARDALGGLLERALAKAERLRENERSGCTPAVPPDHELLVWFAESDPRQFCTNQAQLRQRFADVGVLAKALRREFLFRTVIDPP